MKPYKKPVAQALAVWCALLCLLAITVGGSFIPLGGGNAALSALVAVTKAGLVLTFFMHLRDAVPVIRVVAAIGLVTLSLLFILSGVDYATRAMVDAPWQVTPPSLTK